MARDSVHWRSNLLRAFAALLVIATALPLAAADAWWIRTFDFPRVQILLLLGLAIVGLAFWDRRRAWIWIGVTALALAYQLYRIYPYTPLAPVQAVRAKDCPPGRSVEILVANVLQDNRDFGRAIGLVQRREPDIFLALETDRGWTDALAALDPMLPEQRLIPLDNTYGMALYSRLPLGDLQVRYLVEEDIPSIRTDIALPGGGAFRLFALHPRPPIPGKDSGTRDAELVMTGYDIAASPLPAIVAGDLNDVAWSDTTQLFQKVAGVLDPRIGRGYYATYNAAIPPLRWPLDHIFFSEQFGVTSFERLASIGSDHFPVAATLCFSPSEMPAVQEEPAADPGTHEKAGDEVVDGLEQESEEEASGENETQS